MPESNKIQSELFDKARLFRTVFGGREDVVPRYWESGNGRSGYSPLCRNEWEEGSCHKPCQTCVTPDYVPLSDSLVIDHFRGKHILGVYPLLQDNSCNFVAADFDDHNNQFGSSLLEDVNAFCEVCEVQEIPCYVLRSKSGHGYHVYSFFGSPVPAWKARLVAFALLQEARVLNGEEDSFGFDRIFPNQDELSGRGFGNLIALPFQGGAARAGQHTLFLDPETRFVKPFSDQWAVLKNLEKIAEAQLDEFIERWGLKKQETKVNKHSSCAKNGELALQEMIGSCRFIKFCSDYPEKVKEPLWYAMISNIVCIRPGGYSIAHKLSKGHPGYDRSETDHKIHHALDAAAPHTCEYIQNNGFECGKNCRVRAPAALLSRKTNTVGK